MICMVNGRRCLPTLIIILALIQTACAYIDPGTGSMIFQVLIASFVGLLFMLKVYWNRVKDRLKGFFPGKESDNEKK
jgi:hypothetical protein